MSMTLSPKTCGQHGDKRCPYGCCRTFSLRGAALRRVLRRRENRAWQADQRKNS